VHALKTATGDWVGGSNTLKARGLLGLCRELSGAKREEGEVRDKPSSPLNA
jgi:hypothetical protein